MSKTIVIFVGHLKWRSGPGRVVVVLRSRAPWWGTPGTALAGGLGHILSMSSSTCTTTGTSVLTRMSGLLTPAPLVLFGRDGSLSRLRHATSRVRVRYLHHHRASGKHTLDDSDLFLGPIARCSSNHCLRPLTMIMLMLVTSTALSARRVLLERLEDSSSPLERFYDI